MDDKYIKRLAKAQYIESELKARMEALRNAVLESPQYKDLDNQLKLIQMAMKSEREMIENDALALMLTDGNKHPHPAVNIKDFTEVTIADEKGAREWCFDNYRPALKLDEAAFKNALKIGHAPDYLGTVITVRKVQIATDLSKYLPEPCKED